MRKGIQTCLIEGIAIGQLGLPQRSTLLRCGSQFQFRRDGRLQRPLFFFSTLKMERKAALPPTSEARGYPRRMPS